MSGIPTSFHIGPLVFHTYGFGLAIAAYVTFAYAEHRLRRRGIEVRRFGAFTLWMIGAALVGARVANIATNWSYYSGHPGRWIAVWQGGLGSFGGIAAAVAVGLVLVRRWWPGVSLVHFADALIPALIAGWALGRVLGPQLMVAGGGHPTHQWFGMYYEGQVGKRVPVPLIQAFEDALLWLALLRLERTNWARTAGVVSGVGMIVWGVVRTLDEHFLLGEASGTGSVGVQLAGVALSVVGLVMVVRARRNPHAAPEAAVTSESSTPPH